MKKLILLFSVLFGIPVFAQQTITITVTLDSNQVWALRQDYWAHQADTNNPVMTQIEWFRMNATNQIINAANRRLQIRRQEMLDKVSSRWSNCTPEQMTNIVNSIP